VSGFVRVIPSPVNSVLRASAGPQTFFAFLPGTWNPCFRHHVQDMSRTFRAFQTIAPGGCCPVVFVAKHESDYSFPASATVKNAQTLSPVPFPLDVSLKIEQCLGCLPWKTSLLKRVSLLCARYRWRRWLRLAREWASRVTIRLWLKFRFSSERWDWKASVRTVPA
jgi:hypothetical protein